MDSRERFLRMYEHREADRIPITDSPWQGTIRRWVREGMPADADWRDYFGVDKERGISVNISPRYPYKVIEETERYIIYTSEWGVTLKQFKTEDSSPEFIDYKVNTPESWEEAKKRMTFSADRIDWDHLKREYPKWKTEGAWINAGFWFGFDVTHSWMAGTETILVALIEEPEWVMDMVDTYLSSCIRLFDAVWDAGYRFDTIEWPDDMGYKGTPFFSTDTYRTLFKPFQKRAAEWAHAKGIYAHLHSCGYVEPLMPDMLDAGIDALNPLEVKAGMDPVKLKKLYGDRLVLHGGINAVLWDDKGKIISEIDRVVPVLKKDGGYIFSSDHSIPNTVSLDNFREIIKEVKKVGAY